MGECTRTCGGGTQNRTRTCQQEDFECEGEASELIACNIQDCPDNGTWTDWSGWGECSLACGGGTHNRTRTCQPEGASCVGDTSQQLACNIKDCSVIGTWTNWSGWVTCSLTCGGGTQTRTRTCQPDGATCVGDSSGEQTCKFQGCPVIGTWTNWSGWGTCSLTCGGGTQTRTRTCQPEGATCVGSSSGEQACNIKDCSVIGTWTNWSGWGTCSLTCGGGTQTRTRTCQPEGATCVGSSSGEQACNIRDCPVIGTWTNWSGWGTCSLTCGGGTQTRHRTCQPEGATCVGDASDQLGCNAHACPGVAFWDEWQSWSACDVTCGQGTHSRYRQCVRSINTTGNCIGDARELALCDTAACQVYGEWTAWSSWWSCDVACDGGTQTRTRTCQKESVSDVDCVGDVTMTQACNSWSCPNCARQCNSGTLNAACDTCICSGAEITVRTQTSSNKPLMDVYAYASSAPTTLLATSDSGGSLTLTTLCVGDEIILTKEGFLETNIILATTSVQANMDQIEYPRMVTSPSSKYRLEGDGAKFCCMAVAHPNITYYEWFKDGIVIDSSFGPNQTELELLGVTVADSGSYRCRANSPVGAVYSREATLKVQKTENDFCLDAIEDKVISLPRDCVQQETNDNTFNVGTCAPKPCRNPTVNSETSCLDTEYSCCRSSAYTIVKIQCSGYKLTVPVVNACTCASCSFQRRLRISGTAFGGTSNKPLNRGQVFVNGDITSYTSTRGSFSVNVPTSIDYQSVTLKFVDVFYNSFHDMVKVVNIPGAYMDDIYISIKLFEKPEPIILQSDVENTLYGGGNNATNSSAALTEIIIPPDSFYYDNGTKYEGGVSVIFTYLLPSEAEEFEAMPGEFQFVDANGEIGQLETLGVFNLQFFDDYNRELTVSNPIIVTLSRSYNGVDPETGETIKLWGLNDKTGNWELLPFMQAKRRRRRQGNYIIGQINTGDYYWRNCDIYWTEIPCYMNPLVYTDISLTSLVDASRLKLTYLYTNNRFVTRTTARWTYKDYTGPACTSIKCSGNVAHMQLQISTKTGYSNLFATLPRQGSTHRVGEDARVVSINMATDNINIFVSKATCDAQSSSPDKLAFYKKDFDEEVFTFHHYQYDTPIGNPSLQMIEELQLKSWCRNLGDDNSVTQDATKACAVKVGLTGIFPIDSLRVVVRSSMGRATQYSGDIVGIREAIPDSTGHACIPYRCTTKIVFATGNFLIDETDLSIFVATNGFCNVSSINTNLFDLDNQYGKPQIRIRVQEAYETVGDYGFYKADHSSFESADECKKPIPKAILACNRATSKPAFTFKCNV